MQCEVNRKNKVVVTQNFPDIIFFKFKKKQKYQVSMKYMSPIYQNEGLSVLKPKIKKKILIGHDWNII